MIYLWVDGEGWKEFELTNTAELEKRGIHVGNGDCIGYETRIGDRASIGDGAKPKIVYITGSRFPVSYWGEDRVDVGCQSRSIDQWLTDYTEIASKHEFTSGQIEEYRSYVEFIKSIHAPEIREKEEPK
jgi:hypothetical protein